MQKDNISKAAQEAVNKYKNCLENIKSVDDLFELVEHFGASIMGGMAAVTNEDMETTIYFKTVEFDGEDIFFISPADDTEIVGMRIPIYNIVKMTGKKCVDEETHAEYYGLEVELENSTIEIIWSYQSTT